MTTTLRPTEPLQQNADGTRSRRYQVCVNSRPVGAIHLGTHPVFGDAVARITKLRIDEPDRRRGRGCRRIEATVPAGSEAAFRLATALGYVVRNRGMEKPLGDTPPELPEGSRARPMTEAEFGPWLEKGKQDYAQSWTERGVPEAEARAKSERDHATLLPDGPATPGTLISVLEHEGTAVGVLWLALRADSSFVFDVETHAAHRGKGHGRTLMLLAEAQTIVEGRRTIGLNVFAGNTPAERLYASLGYETNLYAMYKPLF
jgi:GNAT superfamily N-acetyltransferase